MKCDKAYGQFGLLGLRVVLGIVFLYHGYDKVFVKGIPAITGFMNGLGLPAPELMAYLVSYGELIGGALMILGLLTFWVSVDFTIIALVALFTVHISKGFSAMQGGYEYILLILAASFFMLTHGAGKYSLDVFMLGCDECNHECKNGTCEVK